MFGENEHAPSSALLPNGTVVAQPLGPGDWAQYWPVDMSFYQTKTLPKGKPCPRGQSCGIAFECSAVVGQNRSFTVAIGPLTLEGPKGTKVVDNVPVAQKYPKHDDHFHVVIDPSRVPAEGALLILPRADRKDGGWVGAI